MNLYWAAVWTMPLRFSLIYQIIVISFRIKANIIDTLYSKVNIGNLLFNSISKFHNNNHNCQVGEI